MKQLFLITVILLLIPSKMEAQFISFTEAEPYLQVFQNKNVIPQAYHYHSTRKIQVDEISAYLIRYQKDENKGLLGEHFSFVISEKDKQILGFTTMDRKYSNLNMLSKEESKKIAKEFLLKMDNTLAEELENLWIERHDEQIIINTDESVTIAGMKYKCYRPSTNDYTWVIIGYDGSIITFERNILWNTEAQSRISEKWLHDNWLSNNLLTTTEKSALILIETQNEWMHTEGKLRKVLVQDEQMMLNSITNIEKSVDFARKHNIPVIHVGLRFEEGYPELANGKSGLRKAIPNAETFSINKFGSQFYETVKPVEGEFVVTGRVGASGFTGSNLDVYLRNNKIENLYLVGYATHVCIESTLRDAHEKSYSTFVISDATSAFNKMQQNYFLNEIVHHFGAHLTTEEYISK